MSFLPGFTNKFIRSYIVKILKIVDEFDVIAIENT